MANAIKAPARMSVAEFLDWCPEDGHHWQLVDGEPMAMAPASTTHGRIQNEIGRLLGNHLLAQGSGCDVVIGPGITPHVEKAHNVRIPDLAITCTADDHGRLLAEPVLVIEIISPGNFRETWANVWAYTTIPSVREILVLSSVEMRADLLRRQPDGSWPEQPALVTGDSITLESIGFTSVLAAFYRTARLFPSR